MWVSGRCVPGREPPQCCCHWCWASIPTGVGGGRILFWTLFRGATVSPYFTPRTPNSSCRHPWPWSSPCYSLLRPCLLCLLCPHHSTEVLLPQNSEAPACLWPLQGPISRSGLLLMPSTLFFSPGQLPSSSSAFSSPSSSPSSSSSRSQLSHPLHSASTLGLHQLPLPPRSQHGAQGGLLSSDWAAPTHRSCAQACEIPPLGISVGTTPSRSQVKLSARDCMQGKRFLFLPEAR